MSKVVVIGAGPAGMMTAICAKENGNEVCLIEKNSNVGKKLNITGKGRCNITYVGDNDKFLNNICTNSKFGISSINAFNNLDLISFLERLNVKVKEERGARVFLASDDAKELTNKLEKHIRAIGVNILRGQEVKKILIESGKVVGFLTTAGKIACDKVVIATGGKSYPATGSNGSGYDLAKEVGHTIITPKPALVPIILKEKEICKKLEGLTLKNVKIRVVCNEKEIYNDFGEMIFTHNGISGPIILSASSKLNKYVDNNRNNGDKQIEIIVDLKPALTEKELYERITRDFDKYCNKEYKNSLSDLLPKSLIPVMIDVSGIEESKKVNQISKEEKQRLTKLFKEFTFTYEKLMNIEAGIVTSGGIDVKEINPKTMQSKIISGLYFAGEVIDIDAYTGGYNLQIAFSTGYLAGNNI